MSTTVAQQSSIPRLASAPIPNVTSTAPTIMAQSPVEVPTHGSPLAPSPVLNNAPKYGTLVPNRIFVGGISSNTTEVELAQLFSVYGNVKSTKIISDRAGVSKGYGFVTFEQDEEAKRVLKEAECIYLRDRKLNIAPAIKKQPFSRSFEEPSSSNSTPGAYFYSPGNIPAGYTFGSGMTYYNPAGPPATAPEQPAVYQAAAGVYASQQAPPSAYPLMYPCAPQPLYIPQQPYYPTHPLPSTNGYIGEPMPQYQLAQPTYLLLDTIQY